MIKRYREFNESFLNKIFKKPKVNIEYYDNGQKESEEWFLNDKLHREDGPAVQHWHENGQKMSEEWWLNGETHREDGPAVQDWYKNGQISVEEWRLNHNYHREDGPARQKWNKNGQKEFEEWWLNGEGHSKESWIDKLKEIGSEHYEEQKMLYDAEKYNL